MAPHRRTHAVTGLAAVTLTVPLLIGCGAVDKAFDCARTAARITAAVGDLQQATENATENPAAAVDALDRIEGSLADLDAETGDADLSRAVTRLDEGVKDARSAVDEGRTPDLTAVTDAAGEVTQVCSPG
ncbi:hypothetical protein [Streptomyces zingiberis]|uniref:Secreted protein n=1 Tax=Streptomyces zingiberis TaxID=2053010 RepID=A0ABX1C108_9ACTN|nr:hypothetical protein [Streptomyces zingiberis]NJQ01825.1 hypothetical protein [Streptomyces zingiberis]